ncbi:hypothetical protein ACERK3_01950 [Phycisphaerales bacterium AB-hyl4]|uniref:Uncharacterized protein n=1 Tax=Natronomicrosphaera hydrolytica TaxID=3242702 RepID=A0ABV4U2D3_9BACT
MSLREEEEVVAGPSAVEEFDASTQASSFGPTHPLYQVGSTVASTSVCSIAVVQLLLAMLAVVLLGPLVVGIYNRLEEPLPRLTTWVLAMPPTVVFVLLVLLMVGLVAKECLMRNKVLTLAINAGFVLVSLIWMPLLVRALYTPLVDLAQMIE